MIEKIMKAVKSSNKRRGRNITIGAVVGLLLSCTAVMADGEFLYIKDSGGIQFSTDGTNSSDRTWESENPYENVGNIWDKEKNTYINNITLSGKSNEAEIGKDILVGCGMKLETNSGFNLINNGTIFSDDNNMAIGICNMGTLTNLTNNGIISTTSDGSFVILNWAGATITNIVNNGIIETDNNTDAVQGIYNLQGTITNIVNDGLIYAATNKAKGIGIYNQNGTITNLNNEGIITAKTDNGMACGIEGTIANIVNNGIILSEGTSASYGIDNGDGTITNLQNKGIILGKGITPEGHYVNGYGIDNNDGTITNLLNEGIILGKVLGENDYSYGIHNISDQSNIINFANIGTIYGNTNAIRVTADYGQDGIIKTANNYGILANGSDTNEVLDGLTVATSEEQNKLVNYGLIIKNGNEIINSGGKEQKVEVPVAYDVDGKIIKTRSMTVKNKDAVDGSDSFSGNEKDVILNALTNTYTADVGINEVTDSIINACDTAVVMENDGSTLILNNTIVNGGVSEKENISTISVTGNKNILTIQGNSVVNGTMESTGENNTLNLYGKINSNLNKSNNRYEATSMNILSDISGFTNINIDNNVTFFEDAKVTGTEKVTVAETGTLNLRLKNTGAIENVDGVNIPKATHAFSSNTGMIIQGEGNGVDIAGTLRFITNGIGKEIYVDMGSIELRNLYFRTSSIIDKYEFIGTEANVEGVVIGAGETLDGIYKPENTRKGSQDSNRYESLNNIYKGIYSSKEDNLDALRVLISFDSSKDNYDESTSDEEQLKNLMSYLGSIYTETPYSYSSELSRKSMGMFRDIITENQFKPNLNQWLIMGGLTHVDGGTKDSYYGQNYHEIDTGTADVDVDMKLTGAYALGKYGYSENVSLGVTAGGNKSEAKLPMSKVKGNSGYIGAFAENYRGNLTLKAGAGIQYSEYDADRGTLGGHSYSEKYSDMAYDIYLNGRYSHNIGENLFLEPYGTLSYTYVDQESADEGSKVLAIETDSKSFDYTAAKVGVDLKKVIPHEKGKSTLSAGVSYTRLLTGADEENITGRFKGENATDFDILVAHKNEHSIGLNAKYALELENGILFDVKGSYSVERDSHNGTGKNRNKGEWIVGAGLGYKF